MLSKSVNSIHSVLLGVTLYKHTEQDLKNTFSRKEIEHDTNKYSIYRKEKLGVENITYRMCLGDH